MPAGKPAEISVPALGACLAGCGTSVPSGVLPALADYVGMLMRWNRIMNLVGTRSWQDTVRTLVTDSFHLADFILTLPLPAEPVTWDLGAGAGLPGIPLRLAWQAGSYTMVELRQKRAMFLSQAVGTLRLPRTAVFAGDVADFFGRQTASADLVVSRAFMPWEALLALVAPHVRPGGLVVVMASAQLSGAVPGGWAAHGQHAYAVSAPRKGARWLWALRREGQA